MTEILSERLAKLPDKPGCYLMRDRRGRIIYVGKALSLRRRVQSYFRPATLRRAEPRLRSLINSVHDLEWIVTRNEDQALLTENELIKEHQPRYNVLLRDDKRYLAIRCDLRAPLPRFSTCRLLREDGATYFGPFPSGGRFVRPVIDFLERKFGLRRCAPLLPDREAYRHCNDDIIRTCSAPCIGRISPEAYRQRVEEACAILRGERPTFIEELRREMEQAVTTLDFERAAYLRDIRTGLGEMARQRARGPVVTAEQQRAAARRGIEELQQALQLPTLPEVIECIDVSNTSGLLAVASLVAAVDGIPDRRRYRLFHIRDTSGPDDPRMMAEAVRRRYSRVVAEELPLPHLLLVDGGITQLHAARQALQEVGLANLPLAGLAERLEELVVEDGRPPLQLPRDSPALKVVMRLRDEAHRFAITHHRRLRNRRIRESALDEIPGIGPKRKLQLLRAFGSVTRIARLSPEELAAQPHIGPQLASAILQRLAGLHQQESAASPAKPEP